MKQISSREKKAFHISSKQAGIDEENEKIDKKRKLIEDQQKILEDNKLAKQIKEE